MKRLLVLIDGLRYARSNCYQHQLLMTFRDHFQVTVMPIWASAFRDIFFLKQYDHILSMRRLRTLADNLPVVVSIIRDRPVYVYDQDIWHNFLDDSPWKGSYDTIAKSLNVAAFLNTSSWWCRFAAKRGYKSHFVRMGIVSRYCDVGPDFVQRPTEVSFRRSMYPHRQRFFDSLRAMNIDVVHEPGLGYQAYLHALHQQRFFIYTEDDSWLVDGAKIPRVALWIKAIEAAARGCFVIRNYDDEYDSLHLDNIPSILTYRDIGDVPHVMETIRSMSPHERQQMMVSSVESIRLRDDWASVAEAIVD